MNSKKSFTLIEIILALIISSIIGFYIFNQMKHSDFLKSIVTLQDTVKYIINKGLVSSTGYASASGEPCSDNYDFKGLTSKRFLDCNDLNFKFQLDDDETKYFKGEGLMEYDGYCLVKLDEIFSNRRKFKITIDCSNIDSKKSKALIEDSLNFTFEKDYSELNPKIERLATPINYTDAKEDDGVIEVIFEL